MFPFSTFLSREVFCIFIYLSNGYLFLKERERALPSGEGAERGGDRGFRAGSVLTAESPTQDSNSRTVRS